MDKLGLVETIEALRGELAEIEKQDAKGAIKFRLGTITLDFHVGVQREGRGNAGVRFWVIELGAEGRYATESIQRVTVTLDPIRRDGTTLDLSDEDDG